MVIVTEDAFVQKKKIYIINKYITTLLKQATYTV